MDQLHVAYSIQAFNFNCTTSLTSEVLWHPGVKIISGQHELYLILKENRALIQALFSHCPYYVPSIQSPPCTLKGQSEHASHTPAILASWGAVQTPKVLASHLPGIHIFSVLIFKELRVLNPEEITCSYYVLCRGGTYEYSKSQLVTVTTQEV